MRYLLSGILVYVGALCVGIAYHDTITQAFQVLGGINVQQTPPPPVSGVRINPS